MARAAGGLDPCQRSTAKLAAGGLPPLLKSAAWRAERCRHGTTSEERNVRAGASRPFRSEVRPVRRRGPPGRPPLVAWRSTFRCRAAADADARDGGMIPQGGIFIWSRSNAVRQAVRWARYASVTRRADVFFGPSAANDQCSVGRRDAPSQASPQARGGVRAVLALARSRRRLVRDHRAEQPDVPRALEATATASIPVGALDDPPSPSRGRSCSCCWAISSVSRQRCKRPRRAWHNGNSPDPAPAAARWKISDLISRLVDLVFGHREVDAGAGGFRDAASAQSRPPGMIRRLFPRALDLQRSSSIALGVRITASSSTGGILRGEEPAENVGIGDARDPGAPSLSRAFSRRHGLRPGTTENAWKLARALPRPCDHVLYEFTSAGLRHRLFKGFKLPAEPGEACILDRGPPDPDNGFQLVGCWAHCRRYFFGPPSAKSSRRRRAACDSNQRRRERDFFSWVEQSRAH